MSELVLNSRVKYKDYEYRKMAITIKNRMITFFGENTYLKPITLETITGIKYVEPLIVAELSGAFETIYERVDKIYINFYSKQDLLLFKEGLGEKGITTNSSSIQGDLKPVLEMDKSNYIIGQEILLELKDISQKFNDQIPIIGKYKTELEELIQEIEVAKVKLFKSIPEAAKELSETIIEKHIMNDLSALFYNFESQNLLMENSSDNILAITSNLAKVEENLSNNVERIIADASIQILKETALKNMVDLYKKFELISPKLDNTNKELAKNVQVFSESERSFKSTLNQVSSNVSDKIELIINQEIKKVVQAFEQKALALSIKLNKIDLIEEQLKMLEDLEQKNSRKASEQTVISEQKITRYLGKLSETLDKRDEKQITQYKKLNVKIHIYGSICIILLILMFFVK